MISEGRRTSRVHYKYTKIIKILVWRGKSIKHRNLALAAATDLTPQGGREFTARRVLRATRIGPMDPSSFADLEAVLRADAQAGSVSQRYRHTCPSLDLT